MVLSALVWVDPIISAGMIWTIACQNNVTLEIRRHPLLLFFSWQYPTLLFLLAPSVSRTALVYNAAQEKTRRACKELEVLEVFGSWQSWQGISWLACGQEWAETGVREEGFLRVAAQFYAIWWSRWGANGCPQPVKVPLTWYCGWACKWMSLQKWRWAHKKRAQTVQYVEGRIDIDAISSCSKVCKEIC